VSPLAIILVGMAVGLLAAVRRNVRRRPPNVAGRSRPAVRRRIRIDAPHLLYCYRRPDGSRIYGGISNEPEARAARHLVDPDDRWWMVQSDGVMYPIRWYPNRLTAGTAERTLVREMYYRGENPANYHHNPGRMRRAVH
jgi:hypothetical protein